MQSLNVIVISDPIPHHSACLDTLPFSVSPFIGGLVELHCQLRASLILLRTVPSVITTFRVKEQRDHKCLWNDILESLVPFLSF